MNFLQLMCTHRKWIIKRHEETKESGFECLKCGYWIRNILSSPIKSYTESQEIGFPDGIERERQRQREEVAELERMARKGNRDDFSHREEADLPEVSN